MFYVNNYLANPTHDIKVVLIGVGGTGSFILPELVALSKTMVELGKKPLDIMVLDPDIIEPHNIGRQKFFPSDVGQYKAETLVNRVNRAYGYDVQFENTKFLARHLYHCNIVISCVDNVKARKKLHKHIKNKTNPGGYQQLYYWIDTGNSRDTGQVILSAFGRKKKENLPTIIDLFPNLKEDKDEPSCSMRASLGQQSFMINKMTGVFTIQMLSSLLLDYEISYSQVYFDLFNMNVKTNTI